MNKKFISILIAMALSLSVTACSENKANTNSENTTKVTETSKVNIKALESESVGEPDTFIKLGSEISVDGNGVNIENNKVTITQGGTYSVSGKLDDGQLIVNVGDEEKVYIILNGIDITCSDSAPIYIINAKRCIIALEKDTENIITDGENYVLEDATTNEPNAAIFSKDDLYIIGEGKLTVNANYNNGIASKDDLKVQSGNIVVTAKNNGIKGKDCINISDGNITINAGGDGIKSDNDTDASKGYIYIEKGTLNITAVEDGIQAETELLIEDGDITISSGGGSENSSTSKNSDWGNWGMKDKGMNGKGNPNMNNANTNENTEEESTSAKGLKASSNITIEGGNIKIDSSDDSIHSNDNLTINNGTINLSSGDDGIHSDSNLTINDGKINIEKSYEGIESEVITLDGGEIYVTASDDGINAAGGNDGFSINGRPGQNQFESSGNAKININGGYIFVDARGDGIDANGSIYITDGTVIVNGPTDNGNGALDFDNTCEVSGGTLIAAGSSGMAETPSNSSTQNTININLTSQEANTIVNIQSESGENIITFAPSKTYQSVVVCSPNIKTNEKYLVYVGGSSNGNSTDGLYTDGEYSGGNKIGEGTVSSVITNITQEGATQGGMGGRGKDKGAPNEKMDRPNEGENMGRPDENMEMPAEGKDSRGEKDDRVAPSEDTEKNSEI
ncbi:hypothetical protein U732_3355 [Clostridium argentinense CDC 2741]|uniref:Dockerin type 1 n=1 Tax=Clostridium argentinense CDC 2741 TaxID=1418104 RepID=A0A0C1R875_9CLOT|nr:carbohydrate-binding domain-containing protein [Clostridium argentinense]ARC86458.1 dockerin type 1 [Clostridium argentinense]KIE46756.1 hypothetical protein U732_3355 [Clostridium argentinense CDC 2741]NFF37918.1 carbohydrate-binding domain-containing protein [Clostridium argentinense]NFP49850.1 carbohydrate-binding domain-containing protein [Clostridium argentinense]NFP71310.1 carbohydrate-binding domain-containing protein [Clostridium argentinense]